MARTTEGYAKEMRLVNQPEMAEMIQRHRVHLVLHGHMHVLDEYRLANGTRVVNGGGTLEQGYFRIEATEDQMRVHRVMHDRAERCTEVVKQPPM